MRLFICLALTCAVICGSGSLNAEEPAFRIWTSADGKFSTEAKLVENQGGRVVLVKRTGESITVPLSALSQSDRTFLTRPQASQKVTALVERANVAPAPGGWKKVHEFQTSHKGPLRFLAVSPNADYAFTATHTGEMWTWNLIEEKKLAEINTELKAPFAVAISPDGKYTVIGGAASINVFNTHTGELVYEHTEPKDQVTHVSISEDSQWVIAFSKDRRIYRYPILGGKGFASPNFPEEQGGLNYMAAHPNGRIAAFKGPDFQPMVVVFDDPIPAEGGRPPTPGSMRVLKLPGKLDYPASAAISDNLFVFQLRGLEYTVFQKQGQKWSGFTAFCRPGGAAQIGIAADERSVTFMDSRHTQTVNLDHMVAQQYPTPKAAYRVLSRSGIEGYFAIKGSIVWYQLAQEQPELTWKTEIKKLLEAKDFATLQAIGDYCLVHPEPFPWADECKYDSFLHALTIESTRPEEFLARIRLAREWVEQRPEDHSAVLMRAWLHWRNGWRIRGSGYSNTVSSKEMQAFSNEMQNALNLVEPLLKTPNPPPATYHLLFEAAKAQSWDADKLAPYINDLLRRYPDYLPAHFTVSERLMRRWGGEHGDSHRYAGRVGDVIGGDKGDRIYLEIANHQLRYFLVEDFFERTGFDYDRMIRGCRVLAKTDPRLAANFGICYAHHKQDTATGVEFYKLLQDFRKNSPDEDDWTEFPWERTNVRQYTAITWVRKAME